MRWKTHHRRIVWPIAAAVIAIVSVLAAGDYLGDSGLWCPTVGPELPLADSNPPVWDSSFNRVLVRPQSVSTRQPGTRHPPQSIVAYVEKFSVHTGETLRVFFASGLLRDAATVVGYTIHDAIDGEEVVRQTLEHPLAIPRAACHAFYPPGCTFESVLEVRSSLPVGAYYLLLRAEGEQTSHRIHFNVRRPSPSEAVLVVFPNLTWAAYNHFGGGSLYGVLDPVTGERWIPKDRLYAVSLDRPLVLSRYSPHGPEATLAAMRVLAEAGIAFEGISDADLAERPELLDSAAVVVLVGHHEYWTGEMRMAMDRYVRDGGSIANFSGNVAWWRVNLFGRGVYKDGFAQGRECPVSGPDHIINAGFEPLGLPPQRTFGLSYEFGGYPVERQLQKSARAGSDIDPGELADVLHAWHGGTAIEIADASHPVFARTGLSDADPWGAGTRLLDKELDGIPVDGRMSTDIRGSFPPSVEILAHAIALDPGKQDDSEVEPARVRRFGIFVDTVPHAGGGHVISFGSIGYARMLHDKEPVASRIFVNAVKYLLKRSTS